MERRMRTGSFVCRATLLAAAFLLASFTSGTVMAAKTRVSGVVNINTATEAQIDMLPGIGKAKARALVQQRSKGLYHSTQDLLKVKGIGKKLLEKIGPYLVFEGESTIKVHKKSRSARRSKKSRGSR
ncbi:MAG: helix-hairpin-helix domain-containing protein [Deltaproteobacteria bacterium]|nr:helix-hairpin-helix domain-containing protein [Deltaproteobacteria bacterium]